MENNESPLSRPPVPANLAKRFANYLIDVVLFSFLISFLLGAVSPVYPLMQKIMARQPIGLMDQLMITFLYGLYVSSMEAVLNGKTIGKYITRTRAVMANGVPVNAQTAFKRGLIRMIPFEQFSALSVASRPWHDRWSNTFVIDERKSAHLQNETKTLD